MRSALIRDAYVAACRTELRALKPGNVHDYAAGHDMSVADFEASAVVSAPCFAAPGFGVGARVLNAVERTRAVAGCNTNLGILLLAAPLAEAGFRAALPENAAEVGTVVGALEASQGFRGVREGVAVMSELIAE